MFTLVTFAETVGSPVLWGGFLFALGGIAVWFFKTIHKASSGSEADWKGQLDIIEYFSQSVFRQNSTEDIVWDIASSCIEKMGLEDCVIYLRDDVRNVWVQKAAYGPKNIDYRAIHEPIELSFGQGVVGRVGQTGVAEIVHDTSADRDYVVDDAIRGSEMAVPIFCDNEVIGVIDSEHSLTGFFQPYHMRVMQNIANICGQKIGRSIGEQRIQEFAKFFELNPNPVARVRLDGLVLLSNGAACRVFGSACQEGKLLPPRHVLWELIRMRAEEAGTSHHQVQLDEGWHQVTLSQAPSSQHVEVYAVDVTEVQEARARAAEAERHKSDFLSVMSHEIRTPLNAILGLIELLMREDLENESRLSHLSYMEFAGKHLQGLLTDVLDLERLDTGNATPHATPFETRDLLKRIVNGFLNRAHSTQNTLSLEVDEKVPHFLVGDVGWITQMLNNLLANALKFTSGGQVSCSVNWKNGDVELWVRDTGKGIAPNDLQRILEPFEQAKDGQINVKNDGVGLGLAITKKLVDLHGGSMHVESQLGQGSSFQILLPLEVASESDLTASRPAQDSEFEIPDAPVLIVDDNELNVLVAQRMVANWGYNVLTARDVDEAEEQLSRERPFVVLLDIHMPGRDGFQAVQEWRTESCPWRDIAVVGLTADAETHTRKKALEAGMNDVVTKPFSPPHLRSVLEHFARKHSSA